VRLEKVIVTIPVAVADTVRYVRCVLPSIKATTASVIVSPAFPPQESGAGGDMSTAAAVPHIKLKAIVSKYFIYPF